MEQTQTFPFLNSLLLFACIVIVVAGLHWSAEFVAPVLFALLLTVLVWPFLKWLEKKGLSRGMSILAVVVTVILIAIVLTLIIASSLHELTANGPNIAERLQTQFQSSSSFLQDKTASASKLIQKAIEFLSGFVANVVEVLVFFVTLLFMVIASDSIVKKYNSAYGKEGTFGRYFRSWTKDIHTQYKIQTFCNLIIGAVVTIIYFFLGVDFAILWGLLAFLFAYIPSIGLLIASIPALLLTTVLYGLPKASMALGLLVLLGLVMDQVVIPKIMGAHLEVPVVFIFLSLLLWSFVFGLLGAFLALPLLLALRTIFASNPRTHFIAQLLGAKNVPLPKTHLV